MRTAPLGMHNIAAAAAGVPGEESSERNEQELQFDWEGTTIDMPHL